MIETMPTAFMRHHAEAARNYGPLQFGCDSLGQRYDDCEYVDMSHDQLYTRFADVWPDVLAFIRTGRFSELAHRMPPTVDPLAAERRR